MKNLKQFINLILVSIVFSSCSDDNSDKQTYLYKSDKLNLTELYNSQTGRVARTINKNGDSDYIHSEFETTFYIPNEFSESEIENYVTENKNSIDGKLKYFINDNEFIEIEIINGQKVGLTNYSQASIFSFMFQTQGDDPYPQRHECSYDGIQDCVQYAVYEEWTTVEALICAFTGGLECIATEAAACIETNCFTNND